MPSQAPRHGPWLALVRGAWLVLTFVLLVFFVAGISPRFTELRQVCPEGECAALTLAPEEARVLRDLGLSLEFYAGYHVGVEILSAGIPALLAGLIFWRRSHHWMGVMVSFMLVLFGLNLMIEADSALVRWYPALQTPFDLLTSISGVPLVLLFYLFPDGRFVPRWTRFVAAMLALASLLDPLLRARGLSIPSGLFSPALLVGLLICGSVGVGAQIYRYRKVSGPAQRQQTKWVVVGLTALFIAVLTWSLLFELFPLQPGYPRLTLYLIIYSALVLLVLFLPFSIVFSILRYRLWDIDLIIRRTLVYSVLTGLLALVYFGSVLVLQAVFSAVGGQRSELVIILSTLAIAALFAPLRRRVQNAIDKRFYRRKYDAARTLAEFGATVRDEVDLNKLTERLVDVVQETMQPESVSLWLKPTTDRRQPTAVGGRPSVVATRREP